MIKKIIYLISITLLISCGNRNDSLSSQLKCPEFQSITWKKTSLNIITNKKGNQNEGTKKIYIQILIVNNTNDTLIVPLFDKQKVSFFSLSVQDSLTKLNEISKLRCSYSEAFYQTLPMDVDTISLSCDLETFDDNEAITQASFLAGKSTLLFESPFPNNYNREKYKVMSSGVINRGDNYKLEVYYK